MLISIEGSLRRVVKRHDAYVKADGALKALEKRVNLRDTELLEKAVATALAPAEEE